LCSFVVGVGSSAAAAGEDELTEPLVGSASLLSAYATPFRIEPEAGQVAENGAESAKNESCSGGWVHIRSVWSQTPIGFLREDPSDIFDHHPFGFECFDGARAVQPQAGLRALGDPLALAREAERLAGKAHGQTVGPFHGRPVDSRDVAVVGDLGPVVREDLRGVLETVFGVVLAVPGDGAAEDLDGGHVETAVSGAEAAPAEPVGETVTGLSGARRGELRRDGRAGPHQVTRGAPSAFGEALGDVGRQGLVHRLSSSESMSNPVR
jgi:hypothetical protein